MVDKVSMQRPRQGQLTRREVRAERALLDAKHSFQDRESVTLGRLLDEARRLDPGVSERLLMRGLHRLERFGIIRRVPRDEVEA